MEQEAGVENNMEVVKDFLWIFKKKGAPNVTTSTLKSNNDDKLID